LGLTQRILAEKMGGKNNFMNYSTCSKRARKSIESSIKEKLLQQSGFSCSICGKIPVVFHHIEEWSKKFSNNEKYLIPICDKCHRRIHGKGGCLFTKEELYKFKVNPTKPAIIKDSLPLERKKGYSFFIGSNLVANGEKASLIGLPGGHNLLSIDMSSGVLKLSVIENIHDNIPNYLIKDNELQINTQDIWQMDYSGNAIKIWKKKSNKKTVFIDLIIKPDIVIVKEMNTTFNGKSFSIHKLRFPPKKQINEIKAWVRECEKRYRQISKKIEEQPQIAPPFNGMDIDKGIKKSQKDRFKYDLELILRKEISKKFRWSEPICFQVLDSIFRKSPVFRREQRKISVDDPKELVEIYQRIEDTKKKYKQEFKDMEDIVVDYGGMMLMGNMVL
jgi:hypothetical protein